MHLLRQKPSGGINKTAFVTQISQLTFRDSNGSRSVRVPVWRIRAYGIVQLDNNNQLLEAGFVCLWRRIPLHRSTADAKTSSNKYDRPRNLLAKTMIKYPADPEGKKHSIVAVTKGWPGMYNVHSRPAFRHLPARPPQPPHCFRTDLCQRTRATADSPGAILLQLISLLVTCHIVLNSGTGCPRCLSKQMEGVMTTVRRLSGAHYESGAFDRPVSFHILSMDGHLDEVGEKG